MKKTLTIITIIFISFQIKGQENNQLNEMISSSIDSYIMKGNDFEKRGISPRDSCFYYICKDGIPADFLYNSVNNIVFFSLENINGLSKSFQKELRKSINSYFIRIKLTEDNQFIITVRDCNVKLIQKNHIEISITDWGIFVYKYSCEEQKWYLDEAKYGGV
ncbi:hypothetical protein LJB91_01990 [Bacteroidales bacterium OttesenSCG-928-L03]|nr:hypothetical protein [Bacteroidales bacterium OttesenSCG-928-L03]